MRLTTYRAAIAMAAMTVALLVGCSRAAGPPKPPPLFDLLSPSATGVSFANTLPEAPDFNILNYLYYYNGGGVAVGDIDGDGLPDLYFTSNLGANRLYRNLGNYKFEDVTAKAGVADTAGWKSGATMADVNGDGRVDIYVSGVNFLDKRGRNVLYVNNGDGTFTDRTAEYGLEEVGYGTQAVFFDYDLDGDLDVYLVTHSTHIERSIGGGPNGRGRGDRLLRNDGGHFTDVTEAAGVADRVNGFGLGVVVSDLDSDGCPDLYVANDFQENDFLYYNNCDGTFTESVTKATGHTSRFSMGVDAADVNDDGRPDLMVADMLPEREEILKTSASSESPNLFDLRMRAGYHPQYARNVLQLNRGLRRFSDVGFLTGVHATDWSWSALFADLDNDGRKDLFVSNGIYRRPNDLDYINYVGNDAVQAALADGITQKDLALLKHMPQVPVPNYAFRNEGGLRFTSVAEAWGLATPGFSNGSAYVDLTNSGALDLVVNNVNAPASIYRSRARALNRNHYLTVRLQGTGANTGGVGAKVLAKVGSGTQLVEQQPTRGFESSVDPRPHFGLGAATRVDTLTVIWPDRRFQVLPNVAADQTITLRQADASGTYAYPRDTTPPMFEDVAARRGLDVRHEENPFHDWDREPLMPHVLSAQGPALAVADVNGDGLDDVYVGGAKWQPGRLLLQQRDGTFRPSVEPDIAADSIAEDVDAAFFDADGDGHVDLYVASGGNEFWGNADQLRGRLYRNDGHGHFRRDRAAIPDIFENASCVVPGDYDGDGHVDLFVGSRVVSRQYGLTPHSHLLHNDGTGRFTDVTTQVAPALSQAGMVSSAAWTDADGDGRLDLVVVGEWMPVRVFHQQNGRFTDGTAAAGLTGTEGWWNSVRAVDLNGDGRQDLVLGNLGLNSYLKASSDEPARMYVKDFGPNGTVEQIITFYKHGVSYPLPGRDELARLISPLRSRYPSYASFGASRMEDIFSPAELRDATVLTAHTFASAAAMNAGHGTFHMRPLPVEAQLAPVFASYADDLDGDGKVDLLLGGNEYGVPPMLGRYDASYGVLLHGNGDGSFEAVDMARSRLVIDGQVRALQGLRDAKGGRLVLVGRNDDRLEALRPARGGSRKLVAARR